MPQTKKGNDTKEAILASARKLFYVNGIKKVSTALICKEADVKLGTLTYYFNKKDDLMAYLYNDYMNRILYFINKNTQNLNDAQKHIHMIFIYYFNIYRDFNTLKFHKEVLEYTSMTNVLYDLYNLSNPFMQDSPFAQDKQWVKILILADNAARRELNLMYISNHEKSIAEVKELVTKVYTVTAQLFSFNQDTLKEYIEEGYNFLLTHANVHISLL